MKSKHKYMYVHNLNFFADPKEHVRNHAVAIEGLKFMKFKVT